MYGGHAQFDGNAAFSGADFMPSQTIQTTQTAADPFSSPAKNSDLQPLTPLTVKQMREAFLSSDDKTNSSLMELMLTMPVTDHNEIAYHFADCIYVHCYSSELRKPQDNPTSVHTSNSGFNTPLKGYEASSTNHFSGQSSLDGLRGFDKSILDYLQHPECLTCEKGVHCNELVQQLNAPLGKTLEAIESLEVEGLVSSTIDECHYKSTANA